MPALLIRMSTLPYLFRIQFRRDSISLLLVTSSLGYTTFLLSLSSFATACLPCSTFLLVRITEQPILDNSLHTSNPIPRFPPVTTATRFFCFKLLCFHSDVIVLINFVVQQFLNFKKCH